MTNSDASLQSLNFNQITSKRSRTGITFSDHSESVGTTEKTAKIKKNKKKKKKASSISMELKK